MMYDGHVVGRWRVGLGLGMKVYDGELVGIARALTAASRTSLSFKHIWIFTDNQAAIINSFNGTTPLPLQPQRKKKPHQIFRRAPTSLVNNHFSPPHPLTSPTFTDKSSLFICFPSTFIN